jgi:hypothetical protein
MQAHAFSPALVLASALAISATNAQSLTTTYAGGNSGTTTWTVQFDITVLNTVAFITAFDVNCENTRSGGIGSPFTLDVWATQLGGTYAGNETNASAWTRISTGSGVSRAIGTPTPVDVDDFPLLPGRYGIALEYNGTAMAYTNGTGSNQMYSNADIRIDLGSSTTGRFGTPIYTPRVWNGTVYYFVGNATSRTYAEGCTGSAGVPDLQPASNSVPRIGATFGLGLSSLPTSPGVAFLILGFSKKTWNSTPLPLDLTSLGAPGCRLAASLQMMLPGASVNGTATYSLPIPNDPTLVGAIAYLQGLSLDASANALGLTLSNAVEAYLGR